MAPSCQGVFQHLPINPSYPGQKAAISQTMFSNVFSGMKSFAFGQISLKFVPKGPIGHNQVLV